MTVSEIDPMQVSNYIVPNIEICVGITGHRPPRFKDANRQRMEADLTATFSIIRSELARIQQKDSDCFSTVKPNIVLITPLASGSDSLAAEVALKIGADLHACLPFRAERYRKDFSGDDLQRFNRLLKSANRVLELPDDVLEPKQAYHAIGALTASQCDILIAIWDGEPARGKGGTPEVVAEAIASSLPVVVIDANGEQAPRLLWNAGDTEPHDAPTLETVASYDAMAMLPKTIATLVAPPLSSRALLKDLKIAETLKWRKALTYPILTWITGARSWKAAFRKDTLADSAAQLEPLLDCYKKEGKCAAPIWGRLLSRFAAADRAANRFSLRYRGGYIANFSMAALAVAFALSGLLLPDLKAVFILAELLTILMIILRTRMAMKSGWHRRWIDTRHLAELLRVLPLSAALGDLTLLRHGEAEQGGGPGWYARAAARDIGMFEGVMDKTHVENVKSRALDLISGQSEYHRKNAVRMDKMDHRLRRIGEALFAITILACVGWLAAKAADATHLEIFNMNVTAIVTFLTALLPAIGAALYGIRMQGDFAGSAERSRMIEGRLLRLDSAIRRDPLDYRRLIGRLRRLTEIMLAEVDQWRQLSEIRPLELPG